MICAEDRLRPISAPKSISSLQAGTRASGNSSTPTTRPTRMSTASNCSQLISATRLARRRFLLLARSAIGREQHGHVAALLQRRLLHRRDLGDVLEQPVEQRAAALGMALLAPAEHDRHLDLVLLLQEALDVSALGLVVVLGDLGAELDLPHVHLLLMLAGGLRLLLLLVLVLRVIEHAADRRRRLGRHLDQVEVALTRVLEGLRGRNDAYLLPVLVDQAHLGNPDPLVDPGRIALRWPAVEAG